MKIRKVVIALRDIWLSKVKWRKYKIGSGFHAGRKTIMWASDSISIGKNFYFGAYSQIGCNAVIGDDVIFGSYVSLIGKADHDFTQVGVAVRSASSVRDTHYLNSRAFSPVKIGDDVWIGHKAIVLNGITIAKGCIIAAGSVVTKSTEEYGIYAGNPAKKIKNRFSKDEDLKLHKIKLTSS